MAQGSGVRCRVSGPYHLTPETWHLSERVQHAEREMVGARHSGVPLGHRPVVFKSQCVAARPEPQQRVAHVTRLAEERGRGVVLREPLQVRLVQPVVSPEAPVRSKVVTRLGPRTPAADVALRRRELRSEEHTSELQSQSNLVCRLLLEKKK